jgi:ribose transport system ATP-binding protein
VEIMRAIARDARVIIMDEPTSSLTEDEADRLHEVITPPQGARQNDHLRQSFPRSHIWRIVTTSQSCATAGLCSTLPVAGQTKQSLGDIHAGPRFRNQLARAPACAGSDISPVAELRNVATDTGLSGITLAVRPGEIVGLIGLVGSGRTEVARAMFGADPIVSGEYLIDGQKQPGRG